LQFANKENMRAPGPTLLHVLRQLPLIIGDRLAWMTDLQRRYGDVVRIPLGPRVVHGVFHPDGIRHVLVTNAKNYWKGRTFAKTASYLGNGLATSEGAEWQTQRRRMNPSFQRQALHSLSAILVQNGTLMLERWRAAARAGVVVDLALEFQRLALEGVARALFGSEIPEKRITDIVAAFRLAFHYTTQRTLIPFNIPESFPLPGTAKLRRALRLLDDEVYRVIAAERNRATPSGTLLSLLVHATDPLTGETMSDQQLRDEVMTLLIAGTDTTGNTLSWLFYNLHRYPEVRARVLEETAAVVGSRPPAEEDIARMDYTRRVAEETLRLFPQNWVMSRDAWDEDCIGGYTIPAGSTVFLGVYITHRRPDFWEDPEKFDPDRFLPERQAARTALCYLPFGAGSRKCIGGTFAFMEIGVAVPMILQRFQIELVAAESVRRNATWSLWPKPGLFARLREIH
jgi:cytochrome P450